MGTTDIGIKEGIIILVIGLLMMFSISRYLYYILMIKPEREGRKKHS